jgi:hypothetical protein
LRQREAGQARERRERGRSEQQQAARDGHFAIDFNCILCGLAWRTQAKRSFLSHDR